MWETPTLTPHGLENRNPELLFWMYVDTYVKDDPSDVRYILTNSIISIFNHMSNSLISTMLNIDYWGVIFDHGLSRCDQGADHVKFFHRCEKRHVLNAGLKCLIPETKPWIQAILGSSKCEILDITHEDIPKWEVTTPPIRLYKSVAEISNKLSKSMGFYWEWNCNISGGLSLIDKHKPCIFVCWQLVC